MEIFNCSHMVILILVVKEDCLMEDTIESNSNICIECGTETPGSSRFCSES